jgi:hypothetical protein
VIELFLPLFSLSGRKFVSDRYFGALRWCCRPGGVQKVVGLQSRTNLCKGTVDKVEEKGGGEGYLAK